MRQKSKTWLPKREEKFEGFHGQLLFWMNFDSFSALTAAVQEVVSELAGELRDSGW